MVFPLNRKQPESHYFIHKFKPDSLHLVVALVENCSLSIILFNWLINLFMRGVAMYKRVWRGQFIVCWSQLGLKDNNRWWIFFSILWVGAEWIPARWWSEVRVRASGYSYLRMSGVVNWCWKIFCLNTNCSISVTLVSSKVLAVGSYCAFSAETKLTYEFSSCNTTWYNGVVD